jgi:hypothetical protein
MIIWLVTMAARTWYAEQIQSLAGCTLREAELIEHIMRTHILHSTLDWLTPQQFAAVVAEAAKTLRELRELGEVPDAWRQFLVGEDCVL